MNAALINVKYFFNFFYFFLIHTQIWMFEFLEEAERLLKWQVRYGALEVEAFFFF